MNTLQTVNASKWQFCLSAIGRFISEQFCGWRITEFLWLLFSLSSIISLSIYWDDTILGIIAASTGMLYTILAGKGKPACFLFGLINTPIYAYIAFKAGYFGDFSLNVYYFIMMFPGLAVWLRNRSQSSEEGIVRTKLPAKGRFLLCALCIVGILALWGILNLVNGNRPFCDSVTNILSIAAMLLTVRRAIEEWVLWIIVDAVEVFMWWRAWCTGEGSISVLLMWLLFLANGIYLLSLWMRVDAHQNSPK
jgi:nicotinamide mononucleotide transporter